MRKRLVVIGVGVALVAAGSIAFVARPVRVDVVRAKRGPLVATVVATGRVQPVRRVTLAVETMGTVMSVTASDGAPVRAGELLVQLDDRSARAALEHARAQLQQADVAVSRLRGQGVRVADADVRATEAQLEAARANESRLRALVASGAEARATLENAASARSAAEAALARAVEQSRGTGRQGDDVRAAVAGREAAQAAVRAAQAALDRMSLRAPFDGVVLSHSVEAGEVVQPGAPLMVVGATGPSEIVVNADESHLSWLAVGKRADVSADSYPDRRFEATVSSISPSVDPLRGTIEVKLSVASPPPNLLADMTVSVEIETGRAENAVVISKSCVQDASSDSSWVWVVRDGRTAQQRVRIGLRGDTDFSIASGIDENASLVCVPPRDLTEGTRVRARRGQ
jgi:HlyD family secretion protein